MKSRLIAGDLTGARADAGWALDAGGSGSDSPIGRYAAVLAHLVLGEDDEAAALVPTLSGVDAIPVAVVDSLAALAARSASDYSAASRALVADFEGRGEFLEDISVADTVLALQALACQRGLSVALTSRLLPER
jgi:hypothetical protein